MNIFPLGFRTKIALWSAAASGLSVLGFSVTSAIIVRESLREAADVEAGRVTNSVLEALVAGDLDGAKSQKAHLGAEPVELRLIELVDKDGEVVVDNLEAWPDARDLSYAKRPKFRTFRSEGEIWRLISRRRPTSGTQVKLAIDLGVVGKEVGRMVRTYLLALPAAMAIAALGGWWVAGRAANPIRAITEVAERISAEDLSRRVPQLEVNDAISRLASVLNQMLGRLETRYGQAQRFSSDASHELRTPIAVLQGKIEEALQRDEIGEGAGTREILVELGEQVGRLKSIVESLLLFSRADGGQMRGSRGRVDLGNLLDEMGEDLEAIAEPDGLKVGIEAGSGLWVDGDPKLFRMAIFNLLQNAVKYNLKEGGEVRCGARAEGDFVRVWVKNTGLPILEEEREAIFERFYRGAEALRPGVSGTGLGLSLARLVARAHGGEVRLVSSEGGWNEFALEVVRTLG